MLVTFSHLLLEHQFPGHVNQPRPVSGWIFAYCLSKKKPIFCPARCVLRTGIVNILKLSAMSPPPPLVSFSNKFLSPRCPSFIILLICTNLCMTDEFSGWTDDSLKGEGVEGIIAFLTTPAPFLQENSVLFKCAYSWWHLRAESFAKNF